MKTKEKPIENVLIESLLKRKEIDEITVKDLHFIACQLLRSSKALNELSPKTHIFAMQYTICAVESKLKIIAISRIYKEVLNK